MLVQQPQSKSKIVTVQAAGKLQEISGNQQENQHFSAGNRRQKNHQVFGHYFLRWPWQDPCYLGRPSTKQINRSYDLDGFGSRMVSIRVLCNPGACSLHVCKCLMYLTVHGSQLCERFKRIQVHYIIIMSIMNYYEYFSLSCSFGSCQAFPNKLISSR